MRKPSDNVGQQDGVASSILGCSTNGGGVALDEGGWQGLAPHVFGHHECAPWHAWQGRVAPQRQNDLVAVANHRLPTRYRGRGVAETGKDQF